MINAEKSQNYFCHFARAGATLTRRSCRTDQMDLLKI